MKSRIPSRALSVRLLGLGLLGALSAVQPAASSALPATEPSPASAQDSHTVFRNAFKQAQSLNATAEMEKLIKKNTPEAVAWIMETAEGLSVNPDDILADRMIALRKSWRGAMDTDFAENMEQYFGLLTSLQKRERAKLKSRYDKANAKYWANAEEKKAQVYGLLSAELEGVAEQLTLLGDHFYAAQAWLLRSNCWEETTRGDDADLYKVCHSCKMAAESLKAIDLKDRAYIGAKSRYDYLAGQGYDKSAGGAEGGEPGAGPPAAGAAKTGPVTTAVLGFEFVEDLDTYERPRYCMDELYNMWPSLGLTAKGSKIKIASLGDLSPSLIREGSAMVGFDIDGNGQGELAVPLTGNLETVLFKIGAGEEEREWGLMARIGTQSDMYQGVQMNMAPTDGQLSLYIAPGASMVGDIGGVPVRVFDDNMDGLYGSPPVVWAHTGISPGQFQPEMDSVVVGKEKRAVPFSEYMKIGEKWYVLEAAKAGKELSATEVEVKTGKAKLSFKGGKPAWLVLKGAGKYENSYFDIAKGGELPIGKYTLYYGELRKGKKQQMAKTLILPGESTEKIEIMEGKTTTMKLGGPFKFDFAFEEDEATISLTGNTVVVVGEKGERYERPWNCVPRPEVSWRKQGTKKGSKPAKTKVISENDQVTKYGWAAAWAPLDLILEKKGKVETSEVQLTEKKNKLFGKINSDWKEQ